MASRCLSLDSNPAIWAQSTLFTRAHYCLSHVNLWGSAKICSTLATLSKWEYPRIAQRSILNEKMKASRQTPGSCIRGDYKGNGVGRGAGAALGDGGTNAVEKGLRGGSKAQCQVQPEGHGRRLSCWDWQTQPVFVWPD